jgi:nucleotide-binding universal stress UspA family protein
MPRTVLVGFDGSPWAHSAALMARQIAQRMPARLVLLRAVEERGHPEDGFGPGLIDDFKSALAAADSEAARLGRTGIRVETSTLVGEPVRLIMRAIADTEPALVAVGTFGRRPVANWILGSVADKLARSAPVPVLLMPCDHYVPKPSGASFRALVPDIGSEMDWAASYTASHFKLPFPANVTLLEAVGADLPASHVLQFAKEGAYDLIALTRPRGRQMLLGPKVESLIRHSDLPVLVMPPDELRRGEKDAGIETLAA